MTHANSGGQYTLAPIRLSQVSLQDLDQLIRRRLLVPENFPQNCVSFVYGHTAFNDSFRVDVDEDVATVLQIWSECFGVG
jgi:hypothetical protein